MSVMHQFTRANYNGTSTLSAQDNITSGGELNLDQTIANGQTNKQLTFSFTKTKLKSFYAISDQIITLYTNAAGTGSPAETFVFAAGQALQWTLADATAGFIACPFSTNVTTLYVTNASGSTANLRIRIVYDDVT